MWNEMTGECFPPHLWRDLIDGTVTLAFRRWKQPILKKGGVIRNLTSIFDVDEVSIVKENKITESDRRLAGYASMAALLDDLNRNGQGEIYRIEFHYGGLDDLAELRYMDFFSSEEVNEIKSQLEKLDETGNQGPWTAEVLHLIKNNEDAVIEELASSANMSVSIFIENVHQLESLALVEPLSKVGCRLSPRGDALLEHLRPCSTERINRRHLRSAVSGIGF